jgi:hypothetical protein
MFLSGVAAISGSARAGSGVALGAGLEDGRWAAGLEVDWTSTPGAERTLALLGGGVAVPLGGPVRARVALLCGLDTGTPAYLLPVAGARAGLELHRGGGLGPSLETSVAWLGAFGTRTAPDGQRGREAALVGALLLRWALPAR